MSNKELVKLLNYDPDLVYFDYFPPNLVDQIKVLHEISRENNFHKKETLLGVVVFIMLAILETSADLFNYLQLFE